jgi:stage III sporulation protein AF
MDIISHWVTQIIVFLLLAIIIDLLIPATSMRRYIKLVIGLILMLIFLKPIFYLFSIDFQSELTSSVEKLYDGEVSIEMMEDLTKDKIIDIETTQDAYILEEMAFQLKDLAREPLEEDYHVEILDIDFLFSTEQGVNFEGLEEVIVYLREFDHNEGFVSIIDEVKIQTGEMKEAKENDQEKEIRLLLQDVWELRDKNLTIKWEGGTS